MRLPDLDLIYLAGGLITLTAAWTVLARMRRRLKPTIRKARAAWFSIVGREALVDVMTGQEVSPPTPSLAEHLYSTQNRLTNIESTLSDLAATNAALERFGNRLDGLAERFDQHLLESAESRRGDKEEQKAMWNAIEAVALASPKEE